jgi:hypothetical protein
MYVVTSAFSMIIGVCGICSIVHLPNILAYILNQKTPNKPRTLKQEFK